MEIIKDKNPGRLVAAGKAIKICHGFYVDTQPTPEELAVALGQRWPDGALDGYTVTQYHLGKGLSFPLQFMRANGVEHNPYFHTRRAKPKGVFQWDGMNLCNPLQALERMEEAHAVEFLEKFLTGNDGARQLAMWKMYVPRLSAHTRRVLDSAIIGADSLWERALSRALQEHFDVRNNYKIGPYRWDVVLPEHQVAIEIDGYAYHNGENRRNFEKDRHKLNDAVQRHWRPLHFTAVTIEHYLDRVVAQVIAVARGSGGYPSPPWDWHHLWNNRGPQDPGFDPWS
ncbi:endonuclease domain-containing protein [Corynebacterium sp.]|uniref:endonuclease domain-containing protein n=1 Tax=Corynebacterium sp. TaxID=1720 RepID=UPI0026DBF436|nr:hypothetical protein [Corynebacterium sp.]MDO5031919.1 hypothetical protein [Corynebacterium sp.]